MYAERMWARPPKLQKCHEMQFIFIVRIKIENTSSSEFYNIKFIHRTPIDKKKRSWVLEQASNPQKPPISKIHEGHNLIQVTPTYQIIGFLKVNFRNKKLCFFFLNHEINSLTLRGQSKIWRPLRKVDDSTPTTSCRTIGNLLAKSEITLNCIRIKLHGQKTFTNKGLSIFLISVINEKLHQTEIISL